MSSKQQSKEGKNLSRKVIISYIIIGFIWLISAEQFIFILPYSVQTKIILEMLNSLLFIIVTALFIYFFLNRYLHNLRESQQALKESEKRLRTLINTIPDFVILKDRDGSWLEANNAALELFQLQNVNISGKSSNELIELSNVYRKISWMSRETDKKTLEGGTIYHYEQDIEIDGENITLEVSKVPIIYNQGERTNLLIIGRNITERKRVEDELRMIKEQLESFFNNSADAILIYDLNGYVRTVNKAFEQMYGWTEEEIVGTRAAITVPEKYQKEAKEMGDRARAGQQVVGYETIRMKKDGTRMHVSMTFSPLRDSKGNITAISGIIRDITERRKSEELLRKSDMLSMIGQLAAGVAHEIRNPLTSLKGFVQLTKIEQAYNPKYVDIILAELDRINTIVNEFMALAKPQAVNFELKNMKKLIHDVVTIIGTQAIIHSIEITTKVDPQLPPIMCEENQLKQVFINVLKNSIEAMPFGGEITIRAEAIEPESIRVSITDQGQGIPPERIPRLGEPFYTTKEKGTGLGLMVSYKIIRSHQGQVMIESELNKGTTVHITLPIHHD